MPYQDLVDLDERIDVTVVPFSQVEFPLRETEDGDRLHLRLGDHEVRMKENARQFENICQAWGVPFKFAEGVSQSLLREIFTEVNNGRSDEDVHQWAVDTVNGELVSYGSIKKPYVRYSAVGEILQSHGLELDGSLIRHGGAEITGTHPNRFTVTPRVGDTTRSGVNVRMNPTMDTPPLVIPWSLRLVCSNGMTTLRERERISVVGHDVNEVLEAIEYQAQRAMEYAERMNHGFADLVGQQVDDPRQAMENILVARSIPGRMHESLLELAAALPPEERTMYDVLNIFTRAATGVYDSDSRLRLQAIGGDVAVTNHLSCSRCGHELD